jgi:adenosylcobinamide-phosphate synthase
MVNTRLPARLAGAALGLLTDRALGEPPSNVHPVAWFGTLMGRIEQRTYADQRAAGARYAACGALVGAVAGAAIRSTGAAVALTASGRMLRNTARDIGELLEQGEVVAAREALPALVGRDPSTLDESGIAAAVIESIAENTVDAVIAPAFWGSVLGARGAAIHRAVNTMDAMVGHRSPRYRSFGTVAARIDDVAAFVPARLTAALAALARPRAAAPILATIRRDAPAHPSPNAGVAEAAFAAALGLELGGPLRYGTRAEDRPRLGGGPRPTARDIGRAIALADHIERAGIAVLLSGAAMAWAISRRRS